MNNKEENELLYSWISNKGKIQQINLLYRATEDGDNSKSFFERYSSKGPTISFIKTKKGRRFGGFTKAEWTDKKGWITLRDENAFLFSLDKKQKYRILKPEFAIRCIPDDLCLVYRNNMDT